MRPVRAAIPAVLLLAVALAGCSGTDNDSADGGGGDSSSSSAAGSRNEATAEQADPLQSSVQDGADFSMERANQPAPESVKAVQLHRAVIRKGNVALRADDVGQAQADVQKVVNRYFGQVTEEKTTTDDEGSPAYTNMVLRIPTAQFGDAMDALKGVETAELVSANSSEDDVTGKLIDTQSRLEAQKRSIARITVLFARAENIRDIMAIESELSRRQADLDSLERQAAFLRGQTSMSTITVSIDQIPPKATKKVEKDDDAGFLTGLKAGWDSLTAFAVALATVLGALLPWLIVVAIVAPFAYLVIRVVRRRTSKPGRTPSAA